MANSDEKTTWEQNKHMEEDAVEETERERDGEQDEQIARAEWRALFNFTTKAHVFPLVIGLLLSIASGIIIPALAIFLGKIFGSFSEFGGGTLSGSGLKKKLSLYGIELVGLGSASWLLNGTYFTFWLVFGELQAKSVRDKLFDGMLQKDMEWYDMRKTGVGTMITRLQTQVRELQIATSQPLGFAIQYMVTTLAALGLAFYTSWSLTLVTLATVPISAVCLAWISARMQPGIDAQIEELEQASKLANSAISAIDTVKCFNGEDFETWQYATAVKRAAKCYLVQARANALQIGFVRIVTLGMFVQGFWYGSHLVDAGKKNPGQILTAFWACLMATQTIEQILPQMIVLEKGRVAGATLKAVLVKMERGRKIVRMVGRKTPRYCDGDIQIRNASFAYPSRPDQLALNNASFFFPAGQLTFVVGRSGSGKSTLGNILMQFYSPGSGDVTIDGESIQTLDTNWLRNNVTLVQQSSVLFNETIFKNIAFGRQDHGHVRKEELKKSIMIAALHDTISELPNGLDTLVGSGGSALSGGQKQRIAIARARLRDTPILVLDEATSALDHITKSLVMDAIRKWRSGKTTIVITHDISQILKDDFAYVLENGSIVQEGYRHTLEEKSQTGPFAGLLYPSMNLSRGLPPNAYSEEQEEHSRKAIFSEDSMDIKCQIPTVNIPQEYHDNSEQRQSRRPLPGLIAPLPPAVVRMSRMSTTRMSMVPLRHFSKPLPPLPLETLPSEPSSPRDIELLDMTSKDVALSRPPAEAMDYSNRRPSNRASLASIIYSKPPRLKEAVSNGKRKIASTETVRQISSVTDILSTVWPNLTWPQRSILVCGFFFAFLHAAATPIFSWVFAKLLATFFLPSRRSQMALRWSLSVLGVAVCDAVASYFMHYLLEASGQAWVDTIRIQAMKRILDQPKAWFEDDLNSVSALTDCLDRNAEETRNLVGRFAGFLFVAVAMMIIAFGWSLIVCWKLTLVALASAPFMYGVTRGFETVSGRWEGRSNDAGDAASAIFTETFGNIRTVRALTLEGYFHKKYAKATRRALKVGLRRAAYSGIFFGLSDAGTVFFTAMIFYYGSLLVSSHQFSTQNILTVFTMLLFSIANVNAIISFIPQINSSRDTATQLLRLSVLPHNTSHEHIGHIRISDPGTIQFKNLSFAYHSRPKHLVLSNLSLTILPSTFTAIVGASGSGKSTLASLLLGLYPTSPPTSTMNNQTYHSTSLTINTRPIATLHVPTLRTLITFVPQSPTLFPTTIAANVAYGLPERSPLASLAHVRHVCRLVGIDSFITSLSQGYSTLVGDGGAGLSGGQVQRIGIARALVRRAKVLVLDEPTSALDGESARDIRKCLTRLVESGRMERGGAEEGTGVTVIVITHEREMMREAGRVVVLKDGGVVEEGKFEELMARGGELRRLMSEGVDMS